MEISLLEIETILQQHDNFHILTHKSPDGDTLGSAFALCLALQRMGKQAKVLCSDEIPEKYDFLSKNVRAQDFEPEYIISVDLADLQLLGRNLQHYADKIDLCIDHHPSNKRFAKRYYIEGDSAATAEIIYELLRLLSVDLDVDLANCIYTGVATDTGCFRHTNTTARTHRIAADVMSLGAEAFKINKIMFDTKSKARLDLERIALESMELFFADRCAIISISHEELLSLNVTDSDFDGISALPRQIEGVLVGVLIKEKEPGVFRVSVRTDDMIDASKICENFGGGGHKNAAGCTFDGTLENVKSQLLSVIAEALGEAK